MYGRILRNQCQNTYWLLCAIEKTAAFKDLVSGAGIVAKAGIKKLKKKLKKVIEKLVKKLGISNLVYKIVLGGTYRKFKKGFQVAGWGYNKVVGAYKTGKKKKKIISYIKYEKILKTKFVAYSPWNFSFYYSSKSRKNVKGYY